MESILISCFKFSRRVRMVDRSLVKVIEMIGMFVCLQILEKILKRRLLEVIEYMIWGIVNILFMRDFVKVQRFLMVIIYFVVGILVDLKVFGNGVNLFSLLQDIINVNMVVMLKQVRKLIIRYNMMERGMVFLGLMVFLFVVVIILKLIKQQK